LPLLVFCLFRYYFSLIFFVLPDFFLLCFSVLLCVLFVYLLFPVQARQELGIQQLALGEKPQPPIPARFLIRVTAADQVALTHHANWRAASVNDWNSADPLIEQKLGKLADSEVGTHRDDACRHDISCLHLPHP